MSLREPTPDEVDQAVRFGKLVRAFAGRRVAVVGDLVADVYIYGRPVRLSREAPVPIVRHEREEFFLGGAANTIANLRALGAAVAAVGMVGEDVAGEKLLKRLAELGIEERGVLRSPRWRTIAKHRVVAGDYHTRKQQMLRIDHEPSGEPSAADGARLEAAVRDLRGWADAWIISDYGYRLLRNDLLALLAEEARGGKAVVADSRYRLRDLRGLTLVTPNELEAFNAYGLEPVYDEERSGEVVAGLGRRILEDLRVGAVLVTRGDRGMMLFEPGRAPLEIPISGTRDIVDVTGAGDTVVSVAALALVARAGFADAARLANVAAGLVVMKPGAASVTPEELIIACGITSPETERQPPGGGG